MEIGLQKILFGRIKISCNHISYYYLIIIIIINTTDNEFIHSVGIVVVVVINIIKSHSVRCSVT